MKKDTFKKLYFQRHPNAARLRILVDLSVRKAIKMLTKHDTVGKREEEALKLMGYNLVDLATLIDKE